MNAYPEPRILPLLFKLPPTPRLIAHLLMIVGYATILCCKLNSVFTPPFYTIVLVAAWLLGGPDERRMTLICGPAWVATIAAHEFLGIWSQCVTVGIDVMLLCALFWASARAERLWVLWATALHCVAMAIHLFYFLAPGVIDLYAYLAGLGVCGATMILATAFGVWDAWAERRAPRRGERGLPGRALGLGAG